MYAVRFRGIAIFDNPTLEKSLIKNCQICNKLNLRVWETVNENGELWCDSCMKKKFKVFRKFRSVEKAKEYLEALEVIEAL